MKKIVFYLIIALLNLYFINKWQAAGHVLRYICYSVLLVILIFIILSLIAYFSPNKRQKKQYQDFIAIFSDPNISLPKLKFSSNMGWDIFTVTFANEAELKYAKQNKLTDAFNSKIESYYGPDFKSERAITYDYFPVY